MTIFKNGLAVAALALTLPLVGVSTGYAAPAAPATAVAASAANVSSNEVTNVYYRRWGGYRGGYYRGGYGWGGAAAGLAAGALIGGAIAANSAPYGYGYAYCMQRYRSYDPRSGTYLNNDGNRYPCP
jgi:hypothetical protein